MECKRAEIEAGCLNCAWACMGWIGYGRPDGCLLVASRLGVEQHKPAPAGAAGTRYVSP